MATATRSRLTETTEPQANHGRVGERILFWRMLGSRMESLPGELIRPVHGKLGVWDLNIHLLGQIQPRIAVSFAEEPTARCWTKIEG